MSDDKRPLKITCWVCPICGYWRQEEATGVHVYFGPVNRARGGERHELVPTVYGRMT